MENFLVISDESEDENEKINSYLNTKRRNLSFSKFRNKMHLLTDSRDDSIYEKY